MDKDLLYHFFIPYLVPTNITLPHILPFQHYNMEFLLMWQDSIDRDSVWYKKMSQEIFILPK